MNQEFIDALTLVLNLASANALDVEEIDTELQDEATRQRDAINLVERFLEAGKSSREG